MSALAPILALATVIALGVPLLATTAQAFLEKVLP